MITDDITSIERYFILLYNFYSTEENVAVMTTDIFDRTKDSQELVYPGTRLAVTEEFISGSGTYSDNGYIFAAVTGAVSIDMEKHEITVISKAKMVTIPKIGSIVVGNISNVSRRMVSIALRFIDNVEIYPTYTCVVHVSQIYKGYLESADEVLNPGDVVRCKIIDAKTIPLQATFIGSQLGVLVSHCSLCGGKMDKIGRDKLKCSKCYRIEKRVTAIDYGSGHLGYKL